MTAAKSGILTSVPYKLGVGRRRIRDSKVILSYMVWASLDYMSLSQEKKDGSENIFDA